MNRTLEEIVHVWSAEELAIMHKESRGGSYRVAMGISGRSCCNKALLMIGTVVNYGVCACDRPD